MTTNGGDRRERLREFWTAWELTEPEEAVIEAQDRAVDAVSAWLEQGATDPEIPIRAVQILLADPERPGWNKRVCWTAMRKVLTASWRNAGMGAEHLFYGQALLMAAWPEGPQDGWLSLAPLLGSAWDVMRGRARQREALCRWRDDVGTMLHDANAAHVEPGGAAMDVLEGWLTPFREATLTSGPALQHVQNHQGQQYFHALGAQLVQVLHDHHSALQTLGAALRQMSQEIEQHSQALSAYIHQESIGSRGELDLLWWGQARYCRATQTPYRRMRSDPDDLLWWAAREAAEQSLRLDVEPAAAYLVETLHGLDQEVFEKKPLLRWMEELHATLLRAGDRAPRLSARLAQIASGDALGLPVTWIRLLAARKEPLSNAMDALAIDLDMEIDRGQWASWIFRETLLDLRLADSA